MSKRPRNDGILTTNWLHPPRAAGQDRKYFPLGTSDAPPAAAVPGANDAEKFEFGLTRLLGSKEKALAYIREQKRRRKNEARLQERKKR